MNGVGWTIRDWLVGTLVLTAVIFMWVLPWIRRRIRLSDAREVPNPPALPLSPPSEPPFDLNQFNAWFDVVPVGLCHLDLDGRIVRANEILHRLLEIGGELHGMPFSAVLHADDLDRCLLDERDLLTAEAIFRESEMRLRNRRGEVVWIRRRLRLLRDHDGKPLYFIAAVEDLGAQKRIEALRYALEEKLRAIVEHMPVAVWMTAPESERIVFVNEAFESIWDCSREMFYANPDCALQRVHPDDREPVRACLFDGALESRNDEINYRVQCEDGSIRFVRSLGQGIFDSHGRLQFRVYSTMDISSEMHVRDELCEINKQLREANQRLQENARLDTLTRCLNRSAFFEEAEKALQLEQRYGRSSTLVFFDLNNFKEVNDNFGHHVGDRALVAFVSQAKARLRTTDELGRYGGDEFVILLRETDALQAQLLLATLAPVVVDAENGNSVILRFSAGVACSDDPAITTVDDWTRIADSQMYYQRMRRNGR